MDEQTRVEWRQLGFFYEVDEQRRRWLLRGSRSGLERFSELLGAFAAKHRSDRLSEHDHFGPHLYLKITTAQEPGLGGDRVSGTPDDLRRLAARVDERLANTKVGDTFSVSGEYAAGAHFTMEGGVEEDAFDPAAADPLCWGGERSGLAGTSAEPTEVVRATSLSDDSVPSQLRIVRSDERPTWTCAEDEEAGDGRGHRGPWFRLEFLSPTDPSWVSSAGLWLPSLAAAVREAQGAAAGLRWGR